MRWKKRFPDFRKSSRGFSRGGKENQAKIWNQKGCQRLSKKVSVATRGSAGNTQVRGAKVTGGTARPGGTPLEYPAAASAAAAGVEWIGTFFNNQRNCFECGLKASACLCTAHGYTRNSGNFSSSKSIPPSAAASSSTQAGGTGGRGGGGSMQVLVRARRGLIERGNRESITAVTSCLKHPERYVRGAAVEALSIICTRGDRDTVVSLVGLISLCPPDSLPEVADAIQAVCIKGDGETIQRLCQVIVKSDNSQTELSRQAAIELLPRICDRGNSTAVEALISCLGSGGSVSKTIKIAALNTLGELGQKSDRRLIAPILTNLRSQEGQVRSAATLALGSVFDRGDRVALSAAVAAATDKNPTVRGGALWAIGVLAHKGDKDAVNTVVSGVQDEYVEPRLCALKALPNVASTVTLSKSDVKALARIVVVHISASDSDVRHAAEHAYAVLCTNPGRGAIDMLAVKNGQEDAEVIPPPAAPARQRVSEPPAPAVTHPAGAVGDEVALLVAQIVQWVSYTVAVEENKEALEEIEKRQAVLWDAWDAKKAAARGGGVARRGSSGLGAGKGAGGGMLGRSGSSGSLAMRGSGRSGAVGLRASKTLSSPNLLAIAAQGANASSQPGSNQPNGEEGEAADGARVGGKVAAHVLQQVAKAGAGASSVGAGWASRPGSSSRGPNFIIGKGMAPQAAAAVATGGGGSGAGSVLSNAVVSTDSLQAPSDASASSSVGPPSSLDRPGGRAAGGVGSVAGGGQKVGGGAGRGVSVPVSLVAHRANLAEEASSTFLYPSPCSFSDQRLDRKRMTEITLLAADTAKSEKADAKSKGGGMSSLSASQRRGGAVLGKQVHTMTVERFMASFAGSSHEIKGSDKKDLVRPGADQRKPATLTRGMSNVW